MLIDQDKNLKNAILNLSITEKDKLLLKLLSKDVVLMEQLRYKLVELKVSDNVRFENAKTEIDTFFSNLSSRFVSNPLWVSPGELMMELRYASGVVNDYYLITKDKIGEVELRLSTFENILNLNLLFLKVLNKKTETLLKYLAGRLKYLLEKYKKLHEDHQFDFNERLTAVLENPNMIAIKILMQTPISL